MIEVLSDKLNGWLRSVLLLLRHVHIVNEDYTLLSDWRSEDSFSSLLELRINRVLRLVRGSLRAECERDVLVFLVETALQERVGIERFTRTSWTGETHVEVVGQ